MRYRMTDPFWAFFGRILVKPVVIIGLTALLIVESYYLLFPGEAKIPAARRQLADRVCTRVVADLPRREGSPSVAVLDLAGDPNGLVTALLREKIQAADSYRVLERQLFDKMLGEFGRQGAPVSRLTDAVSTARQIGVDLVVFGEVSDFFVDTGRSSLRLEARMAERQSGQAVFARSYYEGSSGGWFSRLPDRSLLRRVLIWILLTILLPVVSIPLIRRLIAMDSNITNLLMLLGYTALDMLFAFLLAGFGFPGVWGIVLLVLALAASAFYNYSIASLIEEIEH